MRVLIAGAIVLSLTGAAFGQAFNLAPGDKKKDPVKEQKDEEIDRAYKDATQRTGTGAATTAKDPWGAVRAYEQPAKPKPAVAAKPKVQAQSQPTQQQQSPSPWPAAPTAR
jgi:hypothetical protein